MGSLSGLGIGLSFLFGLFLFGLVAELYYLLWWKKRYPNRSLQNPQPTKNPQDFSLQFCCKPLNAAKGISAKHELPIIYGNGHDQHLELGGEEAKEFVHKNHGESESIESELMRLHNLSGPPRFLFTIVEETEDLECEEKSRNTRSLGEFFLKSEDSPYLTPMASPNIKIQSFDNGNQFGFNPLYESSTDWEISRLKTSPPPKFKFLRDAEEKLLKKLMESAGETKCQSNGDLMIQDYGVCPQENDKTFVRIVVEKSKEKEIHQQLAHYNHSTASQVLPLTMSPSEFRPHDQDFYRN